MFAAPQFLLRPHSRFANLFFQDHAAQTARHELENFMPLAAKEIGGLWFQGEKSNHAVHIFGKQNGCAEVGTNARLAEDTRHKILRFTLRVLHCDGCVLLQHDTAKTFRIRNR